MLKKLTAFFLSASLLCAQSISPGDLIYNIKNIGTGSTAVGLAPSTSTDILAFDGAGRLTRVPRSTFATSGGAGTGSVTSVALALPSIFSVSGSPITASGTLTGTLATQTANTVFAGPATGSASTPTFRALVVADIPNLSGVYEPLIGTGTLALAKLAVDPLARANHTGTQAWSTIASTPTTLAGYGISDAITAAVAASTYEPIIGTGTLALSKLATDPLARANHTGTQALASISDAGALAALNAVASAQITNGTIVDEDIHASAAISPSKLAASANVVSLLGAADYAAVRSQLGLGTLATQSATITDYLLVSTAVTTYQSVTGVLGLAGFSSITGTLADGNIASAATWNAKQSALTFSTGLTNTTGTITVNTSQNISTLSNLTGNGFVKTSGGTGTLVVDTTVYEPLIGTGTLALSKLATDPLARANHTGTQLLATISDAGTLAALNTIASAQITDGTIVNADLSASAAIAVSKLNVSANVATLLGTANYSAFRTALGLGAAALLATSEGGNATADNGKVVIFGSTGALRATSSMTVFGGAGVSTQYGSLSHESLLFYNGTHGLTISRPTLTDNRGLAWPDADGTIITTGNLSSITATGTITSGTWNGSIIAPAYLGTGSDIATKFLRGDGTWQTIAGGGDALTSNSLSQFAATTSAQLRGVLSDESGTGEFLTTNGSAASLTSFPTLNQNTTGSAATLTTPRNINGVAFDGSANITITSAADTLTGSTLNSGVTASSLTSVGTLTTGVWDATSIAGTKVDAATTTTRGTVELATDGETSANVAVQGNDTRLTNASKVEIGVAASDETSDNTASTTVPKVTFRMPHAMTLTAVRCSLTKAATGATFIVDIHESGTTIMSTNKLSVDASETTSTTAATAAGITDASLADDALIEVFIDQVGTTTDNTGEGVKVWLIGTR